MKPSLNPLRVACLALLAFALFTLGQGSALADFITATLSVTNTPANGATIANGADIRMWTNGPVQIPSTQIQITNNNVLNASNLWNQIAGNRFQFLNATWDGVSSNIVISGIAPWGLTLSSGWCSITYVTNTTVNSLQVAVPFSNFAPTNQTKMASQLVSGIDANTTNAFSATSPALVNYVSLAVVQTIGNKVLTNTIILSGTNNGVYILNAPGISGTVISLTNGGWTGANLTNGQNFGNPFRSPGGGTGSEQFGLGASASTDGACAFGDGAQAIANASVAYGQNAQALGEQSISIGNGSSAESIYTIAIGYGADAAGNSGGIAIGKSSATGATDTVALGHSAVANDNYAIAIGASATSSHSNSVALGYGSSATASHQIMMGTSSETTVIPGPLQLQNGISNLVTLTSGTSVFNGILTIPSFANSSLANSNNAALNISTNAYVQLSGPTGAFYIAGIAGGVDGRIVQLENSTGQAMVIGNQSGVDATAANRILTGYSADRTFTNNPAVITLRYDGAAQRWKITGVN